MGKFNFGGEKQFALIELIKRTLAGVIYTFECCDELNCSRQWTAEKISDTEQFELEIINKTNEHSAYRLILNLNGRILWHGSGYYLYSLFGYLLDCSNSWNFHYLDNGEAFK